MKIQVSKSTVRVKARLSDYERRYALLPPLTLLTKNDGIHSKGIYCSTILMRMETRRSNSLLEEPVRFPFHHRVWKPDSRAPGKRGANEQGRSRIVQRARMVLPSENARS